MSGPINRIPLGLMSLLDIRNAQYPSQMADFVQPGITIDRFLRGSVLEHLASPAINVNANSQFLAAFTTPFTQQWFLADFTIWADSLDVDQLINFAAAYTVVVEPGTARAHLLGDYVSVGTGGNHNNGLATAWFGMPRVLPPASLLGVNVKLFTPGAALTTTLQATASIVRLTA